MPKKDTEDVTEKGQVPQVPDYEGYARACAEVDRRFGLRRVPIAEAVRNHHGEYAFKPMIGIEIWKPQ